jgi:hypothetical protein
MFEWLEMTPYATWVRESLYGWAINLTFHAFGNGLVVGIIFIIALRLLGLFQTVPFSTVRRVLIPLIWLGVIMQVVSGVGLFMTKPGRYAAEPMFQVKMLFLLTGIAMTLLLQRTLKHEAHGWAPGTAGPNGRRFAGLAALAWCGVLVMGRLTAYVGQLYDAPGS